MVWCQASEDYEEAAQVTWFLHEMWLALYFLAERNGATSWIRLQDLVFSSWVFCSFRPKSAFEWDELFLETTIMSSFDGKYVAGNLQVHALVNHDDIFQFVDTLKRVAPKPSLPEALAKLKSSVEAMNQGKHSKRWCKVSCCFFIIFFSENPLPWFLKISVQQCWLWRWILFCLPQAPYILTHLCVFAGDVFFWGGPFMDLLWWIFLLWEERGIVIPRI